MKLLQAGTTKPVQSFDPASLPALHSREFQSVTSALLSGTLSPIPSEDALRHALDVSSAPGMPPNPIDAPAGLGGASSIAVEIPNSTTGMASSRGRSVSVSSSEVITFTRDLLTGSELSPPVLASKATLLSPFSQFIEGCFHNHGMVTAGSRWPEAGLPSTYGVDPIWLERSSQPSEGDLRAPRVFGTPRKSGGNSKDDQADASRESDQSWA